MGERVEESDATCFGCGHPHRPRTDMDLLCDNCRQARDELNRDYRTERYARGYDGA